MDVQRREEGFDLSDTRHYSGQFHSTPNISADSDMSRRSATGIAVGVSCGRTGYIRNSIATDD